MPAQLVICKCIHNKYINYFFLPHLLNCYVSGIYYVLTIEVEKRRGPFRPNHPYKFI